jgi:hypothetical protein
MAITQGPLNASRERLTAIRKALPLVRTQNYYRRILIWCFSTAIIFLLAYVVRNLPVSDTTYNHADRKEQKAATDPSHILFGVTLQITLLVSITALLVAGQTDIAAGENSEVSKLATDLAALEQTITTRETELEALKTSVGFAEDSIPELVQLARKDPKVRKALGRSTCNKLRAFAQIREELENLAQKIGTLESESRNLVISKERLVFGFVFALVPCLSSVLVAVHMVAGTLDRFLLKERYLALATISGVCASAAYALLARRKTSEKQFLEDLRGVNVVLQTITDLVKSSAPGQRQT